MVRRTRLKRGEPAWSVFRPSNGEQEVCLVQGTLGVKYEQARSRNAAMQLIDEYILEGVKHAAREEASRTGKHTCIKVSERSGQQGAEWECTNGNWIECMLDGQCETETSRNLIYRVEGYQVYFNASHLPDDHEHDQMFFVDDYGSPAKALKAAKQAASK